MHISTVHILAQLQGTCAVQRKYKEYNTLGYMRVGVYSRTADLEVLGCNIPKTRVSRLADWCPLKTGQPFAVKKLGFTTMQLQMVSEALKRPDVRTASHSSSKTQC